MESVGLADSSKGLGYWIVDGDPGDGWADKCAHHPWGPYLNLTSDMGVPDYIRMAPGVQGAGCRCCDPPEAICTENCQLYTYTECDALCKARGNRLCSASEVMQRAVAGTGCWYDAIHVWTSSPWDTGGPPTRPPRPTPTPTLSPDAEKNKTTSRITAAPPIIDPPTTTTVTLP